jgi:hypothetical protein
MIKYAILHIFLLLPAVLQSVDQYKLAGSKDIPMESENKAHSDDFTTDEVDDFCTQHTPQWCDGYKIVYKAGFWSVSNPVR